MAAPVYIFCPVTNILVLTGLANEAATFESLNKTKSQLQCHLCGKSKKFQKCNASIESSTTKRSLMLS